jgi:hypothetical protein
LTAKWFRPCLPRLIIYTGEIPKIQEDESDPGDRRYIVSDVTYQQTRVAVSVITGVANHFSVRGWQRFCELNHAEELVKPRSQGFEVTIDGNAWGLLLDEVDLQQRSAIEWP